MRHTHPLLRNGRDNAKLACHCTARYKIEWIYMRIYDTVYCDMPKKAKVGTASGKAAAKAKNTSDSGNEENCNCGLCCEPVKDDEDDGLYCEGACAQWFHRYCAGVTVPQFERLSSSSSPFLCYACFQEEQRAKVSSLEDKVASLTAELSELKTVLESHQEASELQSWSTVVRRGSQRQQRGSRSKPNSRQEHQRPSRQQRVLVLMETH